MELGPTEFKAVCDAVPKRQAEFAAGRTAAKRALTEMGIIAEEIPIGTDRAPQWPRGIVGTISHTADIAIAVLAQEAKCVALGVDIEVTAAVGEELFPLVLVPSEHRWLQSLPKSERVRWATVVFSAKEAFYKFQSSVLKLPLDFQDVEVSISSGDGLTIRILRNPLSSIESATPGCFRLIGPFTVTAFHRSRALNHPAVATFHSVVRADRPEANSAPP